jgi:hypothetical protein
MNEGSLVSFFMNQTLSEELVACQVPATCSDDVIPTPAEESGLVFLNLSSPIIGAVHVLSSRFYPNFNQILS